MNRNMYVIGNWKMNHLQSDVEGFITNLKTQTNIISGVAPQAIHLNYLKQKAPKDFLVGAQNCSNFSHGAYTGEISASSLKDQNCNFVILGHSERRHKFLETDKTINEKAIIAFENKMDVIFCIGETLEDRDNGKTEEVLAQQLSKGLLGISSDKLIIAYEPVWAIGTGKTATPQMAEDAHLFIRSHIKKLGLAAEKISILYGGSVKPSNAEELLSMPNIDGALVGGASLKAEDFNALCLIGQKVRNIA